MASESDPYEQLDVFFHLPPHKYEKGKGFPSKGRHKSLSTVVNESSPEKKRENKNK